MMQRIQNFQPQTILIYSVGLLGSSIGLGLKKSGYQGKIIGLSSPENIKTAQIFGCIDEGYSYNDLELIINRVDLVFLCSPITIILDTINTLSTLELPNNLVITDIGSTKGKINKQAHDVLPEHVHFIGGHPMAGSEKSGPAAADPYLFQNAIYVLSPFLEQPQPLETQFANFLQRYLGCRCIFLNPEIHDTIAATVSHIPHLLAVALVNLTQHMENQLAGTLQLAAGGFKDLTRIASAPYKMWHDIFLTNKESIEPLLDKCIEIVQDLKNRLGENNLESPFNEAKETRQKIPFQKKGFITPLHEILVLAEDRPGFIAAISGILANKQLNIKDIEVLKMREGEGGTIKLAFDSYELSESAISLLVENGYSAWKRG